LKALLQSGATVLHEPYISPEREALLEDLNEGQRRAVIEGGGPLLVVAGAGTGKTRVLTRRVAWLVSGGVAARRVLAITFTNKAARVLKERLAGLPGAEGVWAGTFHAFGAWLLRRHGHVLGWDPGFTILDREDQERLVRDLLQDLGFPPDPWRPSRVVELVSRRKNGGGGRPARDLDASLPSDRLAEVIEAYGNRLRGGQLLDFDDLLLEPLRMLRESPEAAGEVRERFLHVLVDEYQDTNAVQKDLLLALLGPERNLTVVGDPDQSIYAWRGAAVRNILRFAEDFPGARAVVLDRNYRSTKRILEAAESVIARNVGRHEKRLRTENPEGALLREVRCRDGDDEARAVAEEVVRWRSEGRRLDEAAVLFRVNASSRALELEFRSRGLPYVVVAGVEFFQRREVKDVLAYARLVQNPGDDAAFARVVNVPRRGVGEGSLRALRHAAMEAGVPLSEAARRGPPGLSAKARKGLRDLLAVLDEARAGPTAPVGALLEALVERTGYRTFVAEAQEDPALAREENVDELVAFARQHDRSSPEADLGSFLERTALVSDQDAYEGADGRVSLMSAHAAKGLEFPLVVVAGAEHGSFPHSRSTDEASLEEERRLFYVAMTRAKERLVLTHAAWRQTWQGLEPRLPSPYLKDVPHAVVERVDRAGPSRGYATTEEGEMPALLRETGPSLEVGDRVRHPHFGDGVLRARQGSGGDVRVTVDFDAFGRKQILATYARLEKLP
jgi:DNA helicase-2/ATP-dependent DNA helicase PcrA